jgi:hypothetical protein
MRPLRAASVVFLGVVITAIADPRVSGPHDRQITEPTSIASFAMPNAKAVAGEDLYVTRLIDGAAPSPNGAEVAVITNVTGRPNLWTVSSAGSWPVQLVSSDERQASQDGLPTAVGLRTRRIRAATSSGASASSRTKVNRPGIPGATALDVKPPSKMADSA